MILLTGASGLLGSHLLKAGLERQQRIRALARSTSDRTFLSRKAADIEIVAQDLLEDLSPDLFDGVETVIHCAGLASPFPADADRMNALNVTATARLCSLAARAGVRTWVQISSIAALSGQTGDAEERLVIEVRGSPRDTVYARTKWQADQCVAERAGGMNVLTIHPTFMLGAWDARPSSGAILFALRLRRLRHYVECTKNVVAASGVAAGVFQALEHGATGPYILGGVNLPISAFLEVACRLLGIDFATIERLSELPPSSTPTVSETEIHILREFCTPSLVTSERSCLDFGYRDQTEIEPLLGEVLSYFARQKMLVVPSRKPETQEP